MRVTFRQGIVSNAVSATFNVGSSGLPGFFVNVNVPNPNFPPTFHFADGDHNYLNAFRQARPDAWGPFLPGIDKYLFVDISTTTGAISFGSTDYDPITSRVAPNTGRVSAVIVSTTPASKRFDVSGNYTTYLAPGVAITVEGTNGGNDGSYTIASLVFNIGLNRTEITSVEAVTGNASTTGILRGQTTLQTGQHWFDTLNTQMKVWDATSVQWIRKVRVFAGKLNQGALPLMSMSINAGLSNSNINYYLDTQVGLSQSNNAGFLLSTADGNALQRADGTFITTADMLVAEGVQETAPVTFITNELTGTAGVGFAAYRMVTFTAPGVLGMMTNFDVNTKVYGLAVEAGVVGNPVTVVTSGIVVVPKTQVIGSGAASVNNPLYVDGTGTLTRTRPSNAPDPVAAVVDITTTELMIYIVACDIIEPTDIFDQTYVNVTGDTMTGSLFMSGAGVQVNLANAPTAGTHAANKTYVDGVLATHAADFTLHVTPNQDGMLDTLEAAGNGIVVKSAAATTVTRSLVQPAAGLTIANATGVAGNPTFALANDLAALEGLATVGLAVHSGVDTWVERQLATASIARITVANGDGVLGNPTVDLAVLADSGTGTFLKFTRDMWGRVSGTTAVLAADVTALISATYVDTAGDTMTGALLLAAGTAAAPSLAFSGGVGHTDKGLYNSGANEVSVAIAGAQKVLIDASGVTTFSGFTQGAPYSGLALRRADDVTTGINLTASDVVVVQAAGSTMLTVDDSAGTVSSNSAFDAPTVLTTAPAGFATALPFAPVPVFVNLADPTTGVGFSGPGLVEVTSGGAPAATFGPGGLTLAIDLAITNGGTGASTASAARTNFGVGTGDSPEFLEVNVGHATDTTVSRFAAGDIAVEGNVVYRAGGTDVAVVDGGTGASSATTARTNLGVGTGDSPEFLAVNIGHATDTTVSRFAAGDIAVEGNVVYRAGGTDVAVADGGTGASTASAARTNLGVAYNVDVQAWLTPVASIVFAASPYAVAATDEVILANATAGAIVVDLPSPVSGRRVIVKKTDASANTVTVDANADTIDGATTFVLNNQYDTVTVVADGSDWWIV